MIDPSNERSASPVNYSLSEERDTSPSLKAMSKLKSSEGVDSESDSLRFRRDHLEVISKSPIGIS